MRLTLPIGTSGLTLSALAPRLYDGAGALQNDTRDLALNELETSGNYVLTSSLDPPSSGRWHLTLEYPDGAGFVHSWPSYRAPEVVVLPLRVTGHAVSIAGAHYANGVATGHVLAVEELVSGAGDYKISGWRSATGWNDVAAEFGGARVSDSWQEQTSYVRSCEAPAALVALRESNAANLRRYGSHLSFQRIERSADGVAPTGAPIRAWAQETTLSERRDGSAIPVPVFGVQVEWSPFEAAGGLGDDYEVTLCDGRTLPIRWARTPDQAFWECGL